jgi:hypothetical protein
MRQDEDRQAALKIELVNYQIKNGVMAKAPTKFKNVLSKGGNDASYNDGGFKGTNEYKLLKANYDTYGKYLPGVSDVDDALTMISDLSDGNYKAAAFTALFFYREATC